MSGWHLTPPVLIDLAEGTQSEDAFPHLSTCAHCQQQLAALRAALRMAASGADIPEPSPLFWDHLSSRVREAVASDAVDPRTAGTGRWISWKWAVPGSVVAVVAAAAFVVYAPTRSSWAPIPPAGSPPPSTENHAETQGAAEAPFSFVADLAETVDWDASEETGLTTRLGIVDRTVSELSPDERLELGRLLNEALAKPGA